MLSTCSLFLKLLGTPGSSFQNEFCSQRFRGLLSLKARTHSQGGGREPGICLEIVVLPSGPQGWMLAWIFTLLSSRWTSKYQTRHIGLHTPPGGFLYSKADHQLVVIPGHLPLSLLYFPLKMFPESRTIKEMKVALTNPPLWSESRGRMLKPSARPVCWKICGEKTYT